MTRHRAILVVAALLVFASRPVRGDTILASFAGRIFSVDPSLTTQFAVGQSFSGTYSFDTEASDIGFPLDPLDAQYVLLILSVTVDGYVATGSNPFILISNDPVGDFYFLFDQSPAGAQVGTLDLVEIIVDLLDTEGTLFSDDTLPASVSLAAFELRNLILLFSAEEASVVGEVTSLTFGPGPQPTPEPSAGLLLGGALAVLAWRRSRQGPLSARSRR